MTAPIFSSALEPVTVNDGESATFKVTFNGQPTPTVKWFRYSFPVVDSKEFSITTTETSRKNRQLISPSWTLLDKRLHI